MIPETHAPYRCWAEIDLSALRHNAQLARQCSDSAILAVVKANAYGHGAIRAAEALREIASLFGVANLHEALELRHAGVTAPILLLSPCLAHERAVALKEGVHICISSVTEAAELSQLAGEMGQSAHVHVTLDTGMGRMGFVDHEWTPETVRALLQLPSITWEGISSHFPSSDEDLAFSRYQIEHFRAAVQLAREAGLEPRWIHLSNSAGVLGYTETHGLCNLGRPGLVLYGVDPLEGQSEVPHAAAGEASEVRPVLTWKTRVTVVRELPEGHGVSYGRTYITSRPTRVATLACGYADGYPRQISGHDGVVLIHGVRCPLLGRVTMDQIIADVTDLPEKPAPGDEAVLLGSQGEATIPALELAQKAGTIAWHIFTGISGRVARVYIES